MPSKCCVLAAITRLPKGKLVCFGFLRTDLDDKPGLEQSYGKTLLSIRTPGYAKYILFLEGHPVILTSQTMF